MITRFRYAWEPHTYHQTDAGATSGGGKPAEEGQAASGEGEADGKTGGDKGGDEGGEPDTARTLTQADVDRIVAKRLTEEKERESKRTADAVRKAEVETARKNGEWQKVAEGREGEIAALNARVAELEAQITERDTAIVKGRVAAKYRLPEQLVARLQGATEDELEADAKALAKLVAPPKAAATEADRANGQGTRTTIETEKRAQLATGRYGKIA